MTRLDRLAAALEACPGIQVENLIVASSIDSTNSFARRVFEEAWTTAGPGPEALLAALEQTAGRGRQGRTWVSRSGLGIYATLLLAIPESQLQTLPLLTGIGVARALRGLGASAGLKWPNDVLIEGRKVGGILIESVSRDASRVVAAIIGFGVNHGHREDDLPTPTSISLRQVLEPLPPLPRVAAALVSEVLSEVGRAGDAAYALETYRALTVHRAGDTLRCRIAHEDLEGVFLGFDERGFLRLETDGGERRLASGEIVE